MTDRPHLDPRTLEDVERILRTTEFASIADLAATAIDELDEPGTAAGRSVAAPEQVAGGAPLPRRR